MQNSNRGDWPGMQAGQILNPASDNPASVRHGPQPGQASPLEVFDRYARESQLSPATVQKWRPVAAKVQGECPRMTDITREWCIGWKDRLIESGLNDRTINNTYLGCIRSLCRWAVANCEMATNPMDGITITVSQPKRLRPKGFHDAEAKTILSATLEPAPASLAPHHAAVRRWIPWLCAYLGARISEVSQLRGSDVQQMDDMWVVSIGPDDRRTRRNRARYIPIHPHLIDQGFLDFVKKAGAGPLFYDPQRQRGSGNGTQSSSVGKLLAEWVRKIGIDDAHVSPNHGWRYHFRRMARTVDMDPGVRDYVMGRVSAAGETKFGYYSLETLLHELSKLPRIEIEPAAALASKQYDPA